MKKINHPLVKGYIKEVFPKIYCATCGGTPCAPATLNGASKPDIFSVPLASPNN